MNKSELIAITAQNSGIMKKDAELAVNFMLDAIAAALAEGEKVQLSGFGVFDTQQREARVGRDPRTHQAMEIPATRIPVFKPSRNLKDLIAK